MGTPSEKNHVLLLEMKVVLSLSLLVCIFGVASAQQMKVPSSDGKQLPPNARVVMKDDGRYVEMLTKSLGLSPTQAKKVKAIHAEWGKKMSAVHQTSEFRKIFDWERSEIMKVLTPEQKKKFGTSGGLKIIKK